MNEILQLFLSSIRRGEVEVYNEFSLQHEVGIYLREHFSANKVQFERNVSYFKFNKQKFIKREIDITVFSPDNSELLYAIELKYPRNGQSVGSRLHILHILVCNVLTRPYTLSD